MQNPKTLPRDLDDESLLHQTEALVREERRLTLAVLQHLREVERRRLFATRGFSSLFDYCTKGLGYSESSAQRRIASMRLLREIPEVESKIEAGKLSLSVVAQAQTFFRQEEKLQNQLPKSEKLDLLEKLEGKSSRETERELMSRSSQPLTLVPERLRPVTDTHSELKLVVPEPLLEKLEQLKGLLAHSHPNASSAEILDYALHFTLKKLDPAREPIQRKSSLPTPAVNPSRRSIPKPLKREIWSRDQGQCQYQDPKSGRRCLSRHALQLDHVQPFARGGLATAQNLRLLCRQHNLSEAVRHFGIDARSTSDVGSAVRSDAD